MHSQNATHREPAVADTHFLQRASLSLHSQNATHREPAIADTHFLQRASLSLHSQNAQMAELVDALVSNTNTSGCTGSSPVLGTILQLHQPTARHEVTTKCLAFFLQEYVHIQYPTEFETSLTCLGYGKWFCFFHHILLFV